MSIQGSNSKTTPDKTDHIGRNRHYEQKCAYHPKQNITNFCKCEECLLPVCPTCIKLHTDQHKNNKTSPKFEEINKVIEEIRDTYGKLDDLVGEIKQLLLEIQGDKKESEAKIRNKLMQHRGILIKQFQKCLIDMQNNIIEEIVKDDQQFIASMQQMDQELTKIQKAIDKNRQNFRSQDLLKHIIIYFGKRSDQRYKRELQYIKNRSIDLTKKQFYVSVDEMELDNITKAIGKYMKLQISQGNQSRTDK